MRICIITEYFTTPDGAATGGVEARAYNIGKRLAERHDVTVITSWTKGMPRKGVMQGMTVYRVGSNHPYTNTGAIFSRFRFAYAAYRAARALAKQKKFDVIEGCNFVSYLPAARAAKKTGARAIATYHEVWLGSWMKNKGLITGTVGNLWEQRAVRHPWDAVISVSECTKKKLEEHSVRKVQVIPNGVSEIREPGKRYPRPTVCFVGRLMPQKRVGDLLDALALLQQNENKKKKEKNKIKNLRCIIVGTGPEEEKLKQHVQQRGLKNVEFRGFVKEQEKVHEIMQKSHVLCHPSILEGFGMVLIESAAQGTPYVCSDIDVFKEVTRNGRGGLLSEQKNPRDLAEKIRHLLTNKKLFAQKVKEARVLAQDYHWNRLAAQVEKLFTSGDQK